MTQQTFIEFIQHLNYMMSAATLQMSLQSKAQEANNYIEKNIDKKLWGGNPWHLILEDATKLREDRSIKARTIAIDIMNKFELNLMNLDLVQEITDIIKKELENGQ